MKLNQLALISYAIDGDSACFILQTDLATAVALDGQALKVTTDAGDDVAAMDGHKVVAAVKQDDGYIALHTARALDPQTAESIKALETNLAVAQKAADAAKQDAATAQTAADKAQQTADEAMVSGGNPEVATFATMQLVNAAPTMTDADILKVPSLVPEWAVGVAYEAKQVIKYEGELYRIAQKHTAQEQYKPGAGTESLYTHIVQSGGYDVWQQPTGAHDAYSKGTRVWYPTADSTLYESLIDANTYSPEAYPAGWKRVTE